MPVDPNEFAAVPPQEHELITPDDIPTNNGEQTEAQLLFEFHNDKVDLRVEQDDERILIEHSKRPGRTKYVDGEDPDAGWLAQQISAELGTTLTVLTPAFDSKLAPLLRAMGYDLASEGSYPIFEEGVAMVSLPTVKRLNDFIDAHQNVFSARPVEYSSESDTHKEIVSGDDYSRYVHERKMPVGVEKLDVTIHDLGEHAGFLFVSPMMMDKLSERASDYVSEREKVEADTSLGPNEKAERITLIRKEENILTRVVDGYTSAALGYLVHRIKGVDVNMYQTERISLSQIGVRLSDEELEELHADIDEHTERMVELADSLSEDVHQAA